MCLAKTLVKTGLYGVRNQPTTPATEQPSPTTNPYFVLSLQRLKTAIESVHRAYYCISKMPLSLGMNGVRCELSAQRSRFLECTPIHSWWPPPFIKSRGAVASAADGGATGALSSRPARGPLSSLRNECERESRRPATLKSPSRGVPLFKYREENVDFRCESYACGMWGLFRRIN